MKITALLVDCQNDFCDPKGSLYVNGAEKDMENVAKMISDHGGKIDDIRCTLDSHQVIDVGHPEFWIDSNGNHPTPFTILNIEDVKGSKAKWRTRHPAFQKRMEDYVESLASNQRYPAVIWPTHCTVGSWGHGIFPIVQGALENWCRKEFALIDYVTKGSNPFTEHYSAVKADVPDPEDPTTETNTTFIQRLQEADRILVVGEASSHCVFNTVSDIAQEFGAEQAKKLVLLEDCMSPVTGFEQSHDDFFNWAKNQGITISKSTDFFA